jgi:hypothetical protein
MSTSPEYSFLVACARADSTAPNTTSRSTFFSREMASTNINISRFISQLSCLIGRRSGRACDPKILEIHDPRPLNSPARASRSSSSVKPSTCKGAGTRFLLTFCPGLTAGSSLQTICQPAPGGGALQRAPKLLAVGGHLATRGARPWAP